MLKKFNLSVLALIVSVLPFYGYFIAYVYEMNYLAVYGVPSFEAQISIYAVILAVIYFVVICAVCIVVLSQGLKFLDRTSRSFFTFTLVFWLIITGIISIIVVILFQTSLPKIPLIAGIAIVSLIIMEYIMPILKYRTLKSYRKNVIRYRLGRKKNNLSYKNNRSYYSDTFKAIIALLFLAIFSAGMLGNFHGRTSNNFYVFEDNKENFALLRSYGNEKIAVKYVKGKILPGFIYIFNSSKLNLRIRRLYLPEPTIKDFVIFNY